MMKNKPILTYDYFEYEDIILGKCKEIPSIMAQGKTKDEVCNILHRMTEGYFEVIKQHKRI